MNKKKAVKKAEKALREEFARDMNRVHIGAAQIATQLLLRSAQDNLTTRGHKADKIRLVFDPNPPGDNVLWTGDLYVQMPSTKECRVFNVVGAFLPEEDGVTVMSKWYAEDPAEMN